MRSPLPPLLDLRIRFAAMPKSIRWFVASYTSYAVVSLLNSIRLFESVRDQIAPHVQLERPPSDTFVAAMVVARFLVPVILGYFVVARANKIARWAVVLLVGPWLPQTRGVLDSFLAGEMKTLPWTLAFLSYLFAITCLFRKDAREWFRYKGRVAADDRQAFE